MLITEAERRLRYMRDSARVENWGPSVKGLAYGWTSERTNSG